MRMHHYNAGKYAKIGVFILSVYVIQMRIVPLVWILEIKPDLLQIAVIVIAMNIQIFPLMLASVLLCGLLEDIFGLYLFGFNTIMFGLEAILIYLICRHIYNDTKVIKYIMLACATVCTYILISVIFKKPYIFVGFLEAAINCLLFSFIEKAYRCMLPLDIRGNSLYAYR